MSDPVDPTLLRLTERLADAISAWRARLHAVSGPVSDDAVADVLAEIVERAARNERARARPETRGDNVIDLAERRLQKQGYTLTPGDDPGTSVLTLVVRIALDDDLLDRLLDRFGHDPIALVEEVVRRGVAALAEETPPEET